MSEPSKTKEDDDLIVTLAEDGSAVVGDKSVAADDDDDDDKQEETAKVDSELAEAETESDREAIRERRRNERKSRGARQRAKVESLEREIAVLKSQQAASQQQVASIQSAATGTQLAQVDELVNQADKAAEHFKNVIADATVKGDGRTVADATEYMIAARGRAKELRAFKQNALRAISAPPPPDSVTTAHTKAFLARNKWYNGPQSEDPDSRIVTLLDNALAKEGWQSNTPEYWKELETRAAKYLPHRIKQGQSQQLEQEDAAPARQASSPVAGNGGDARAPHGGKTFTLSPARVAAIKDAGKWDNPTERDRMIKAYRSYDQQHTKG